MSVCGIGTDIVSIERIAKIYDKFGKAFLDKNFHSQEIKCFEALTQSQRITYLAKRFAGKEAHAKALGSGIGQLAFKDIAILNDERGAPYILCTDKLKSIINKPLKIHVSLSDDMPFAVAFVVISR